MTILHFRSLILAIVFLASPAAGQLIENKIKVKEGTITLYLPPLSPGTTISGTVVAEPSGATSSEQDKNKGLLSGYQLILGDKKLPLAARRFSLQVPSLTTGLSFELINSAGKKVSEDNFPIKKERGSAESYSLPGYYVIGEPARIAGPFDGSSENSIVKINGVPAEILAESTNELYFKSSAADKGSSDLECSESGITQKRKSNALQLELSAEKLNLRKGESTTLHIKVSGLEGMTEQVPLTIINESGATISLSGGNTQSVTIGSSAEVQNGVYHTTRNVQSLRNGNFTVAASIVPPTLETLSDNAQLLCNCFIGQNTHLLPPSSCRSLGGKCGATLPETSNAGTVDDLSTIVVFPKPGQMNQSTGKMKLELAEYSNNVAAVVFSSRPAGANDWVRIGAGTQNGTNWNCDWTVPLGNDGIHNLRAKIVSKNNSVIVHYNQTQVSLAPLAVSKLKSEAFTLTVSESQIKEADEKARRAADSLQAIQERIAALEAKLKEQNEQAAQKKEMAAELVVIDAMLEKIPSVFRDSLKKLTDSLKKIQGVNPPPVNKQQLQQNADDAAQRLKDCLDRLAKLKQEKADLQNQSNDLKAQMDGLLKQMDQLHLGNGWIGGHGYYGNGLLWYGYVGDESSNVNIDAEARAIDKQLKPLNKAYMKNLKRLKDLDKEIADAEKDCDKIQKEKEQADQALQNNNNAMAIQGQLSEINRQIQGLLDVLRDWCAAHPGVCNFEQDLKALEGSGMPSAAFMDELMDKINALIGKKQKLESDLQQESNDAATNAENTGNAIDDEKEKAQDLADELARQQAEANRLRQEREKELEAERQKQRTKEAEEKARQNTPKPQPTLPQPVNPSDDQIKFQAQRLFRDLYQKYLIEKGPCDCITKAIALANNTNTIVSDIIGRIGVAVAFAPLEAFPGLSLGTRLGIGAAKALASAVFGGESFPEELAKNLFNVIGGEIFPQLVGDDFLGNRLNDLASGGMDAIMEAEGVRSISWEGETELRHCGKVKGKTVTLVNPNTGWVVIMIKIDNCPLIVIKYKINKDGVPISTPSVQKISG